MEEEEKKKKDSHANSAPLPSNPFIRPLKSEKEHQRRIIRKCLIDELRVLLIALGVPEKKVYSEPDVLIHTLHHLRKQQSTRVIPFSAPPRFLHAVSPPSGIVKSHRIGFSMPVYPTSVPPTPSPRDAHYNPPSHEPVHKSLLWPVSPRNSHGPLPPVPFAPTPLSVPPPPPPPPDDTFSVSKFFSHDEEEKFFSHEEEEDAPEFGTIDFSFLDYQ